MDRNEALKLVDKFLFEIHEELYSVTVGDSLCEIFVYWLGDKNYEIVDRSIPEEHIKEINNETK